jgi:UDP-N-acetylglucosamine/UDP-N-acetylgalactosamine diphosphorylase
MIGVPQELMQRLRAHKQEHVLAWWDQLNPGEQEKLVDQLQSIDFPRLRDLFRLRDQAQTLPPLSLIKPVRIDQLDRADQALVEMGEESLRRGEVAVLMVAGGQGSRLGFDHPKGMFPIGPVTKRSLFQIHAEKVLALSRHYGKPIPYLVMTSPATDAETKEFFQSNGNFGLPADEILFFQQGSMPALDLQSGKLLMESKGRLFLGPNGHGGTITALKTSGLLDRLEKQGIKNLFYFQVDNPLVEIADPLFLGHHLLQSAEVSSKAIPKDGPYDRLGNFVDLDGRCIIIEYSDLPESMATLKDDKGQLRFRAGSPAIHLFSLEFLRRVTQGQGSMPYHIAHKKVPYLDGNGEKVNPETENALKFELFIFDALPLANRWTVVEASRIEEFAPLKNATGADSPESARQAMSNLAAIWLEQAGVKVPRNPQGQAAVPLEVSPFFALDAKKLAARIDKGLKISGPLCLS